MTKANKSWHNKSVSIHITNKLFSNRSLVIICVVAVGSFVFNTNKNKVDYSAYKKVDVTNSIDGISNDDLINYLENVNTITNANSLTTLDVKLPDVQDHLQVIPDEELKQYLNDLVIPLSEDKKEGI